MTKISTYPQRAKTVDQRFEEKIERGPSCWIWTSAIGGSLGYGVFWLGQGKSVFAHRYALEKHLGHPLPGKALVMHSCDTPTCVNPAHLSLGSALENMLDAKAKGRLAEGERNGGGRKLTIAAVEEIKRTDGIIGCTKSAAIFGVSAQTVKAIRRGRIWKSVEAKA